MSGRASAGPSIGGSAAGDATLLVADPSTTSTGRLVNATFALPQPLQGLGVVKTYAAPVSNDQPVITFKQAIGAGDALRTGTHSKTLTFTPPSWPAGPSRGRQSPLQCAVERRFDRRSHSLTPGSGP